MIVCVADGVCMGRDGIIAWAATRAAPTVVRGAVRATVGGAQVAAHENIPRHTRKRIFPIPCESALIESCK
jgi:hypothetical protein